MFDFFRKNRKAKSAAQKKIEDSAKSSMPVIMQGVISASILNVRGLPSKSGIIVGKLTKNTFVSIFKVVDQEWYMIKYNNAKSYIASKYVKPLIGIITANVLNVRDQPTLNSTVVGKLSKSERVEIIMRLPEWYKIIYNSYDAYIYSKFVKFEADDSTSENKSIANDLLKDNHKLLKVKLEPGTKINVPKEPRESRIVAKTYNNFGGLIKTLSKEINIDIATAVAVIAVESAGKGFGDSGNVLIRFENHLFYRFWGVKNKDKFNKHFTFDSDRKWERHMFRKDEDSEWKTFHGDQEAEWEVLSFARSLDNDTALLSASYGAPQILGTNFKKIGYINTEDMLFYFSRDIKYQIFALFDFFNPQMIKHLQKKEFKEFAGYYNGKGQEARYGAFIRKHYKAFKAIKV